VTRYALLIATLAVIALPTLTGAEQPSRWHMDISTASLETILLHPETILEDPDAFWATDEAYQLSTSWHRNTGVGRESRDYDRKWLAFIGEMAATPPDERAAHPAFEALEGIRARVPLFEERSVPLLDSFLPANGLVFDSTIHLTTRTYSFQFMTNGQIVADPLSDYFGGDLDMLFNLVTHECFHIGYGWNRYLRTEFELEDSFVYNTLLDGLQNEGMAVYVGYKTREFFPAPQEEDYHMLDDPSEVRRQIAALNGLIEMTRAASGETLTKHAWRIGVVDRAYYVVGAHMARTIDEALGRDALLQTIATGPLNFVDVYNRLVEESMRVTTVAKPAHPTLLPNLKAAAVDNDVPAFEMIAARMKADHRAPAPGTQRQLERFGYGMIYANEFDWAVEVFRVDVDLFPESANALDCLAEAYWKAGNEDRAEEYYQRALEVDPRFANAAKMLEKLRS